jgi:hypothetical protein
VIRGGLGTAPAELGGGRHFCGSAIRWALQSPGFRPARDVLEAYAGVGEQHDHGLRAPPEVGRDGGGIIAGKPAANDEPLARGQAGRPEAASNIRRGPRRRLSGS